MLTLRRFSSAIVVLLLLSAICIPANAQMSRKFTLTGLVAATVGDVVVADITADESVLLTTTVGHENVVGIAAEAAEPAAEITVRLCGGYASVVNVTGTVASGDVLITSTTAGRARTATDNESSSGFGFAMSNNPSGLGTVAALLSRPNLAYSADADLYIDTLHVTGQITSTLADGTAPLVVTSTTVNTNLNADLLDGNHAAAFQAADATLTALAGAGAANTFPYFTNTDVLGNASITAAGLAILDDAAYTNQQATLHLQPGTDVQAYDVELGALASVTSAANALPYFTGSGTAGTTTLSAFGRSIIDDADEAAFKATVNLEIGTDVQAYDVELAALAGLTSAANKVPYFTGSGTAGLIDVPFLDASVDNDQTIESTHQLSATTASTPVISGVATSSATTTVLNGLMVKHLTVGNMADGFGAGLQFRVTDPGALNQVMGSIAGVRESADNEGALVFYAGTDGLEEVGRLDHSGNLTLLGTIGDADVADTLTIGSGSTMSSPPAIGGVAPAAGSFTALSATALSTSGVLKTSTITTFAANDTTPTVVAGNIFVIPGTWTAGNNITMFDGGVMGQQIVVIGGDPDCTVVNGGNLALQGDWVGEAGYTLPLVFDGASWRETTARMTATGGGAVMWTTPGTIGSVTPNTGKFTTLEATGATFVTPATYTFGAAATTALNMGAAAGTTTIASYKTTLGNEKTYHYRLDSAVSSTLKICSIDVNSMSAYGAVGLLVDLYAYSYAAAYAGTVSGYFMLGKTGTGTPYAVCNTWGLRGTLLNLRLRDMGSNVYEVWATVNLGGGGRAEASIRYIDGGTAAAGIVDLSVFNTAASGGSSDVAETLQYTFGNSVSTVGGLHVGGTSDPGTDNLLVDGTAGITGVLTATAAANVINIGTSCTMGSPPAIGGTTQNTGAFSGVAIGVEDTTAGNITMNGNNAAVGPTLYMRNAANNDANVEYWYFQAGVVLGSPVFGVGNDDGVVWFWSEAGDCYIPTGGLSVGNAAVDPDNGDIYAEDNVSALSFTDRTPFYEGDALTEIAQIKGKEGKIDHATLPAFARVTETVTDLSGVARVEERRDIGAMVSMLTVAVQQLEARNAALEARLVELEKKPVVIPK